MHPFMESAQPPCILGTPKYKGRPTCIFLSNSRLWLELTAATTKLLYPPTAQKAVISTDQEGTASGGTGGQPGAHSCPLLTGTLLCTRQHPSCAHSCVCKSINSCHLATLWGYRAAPQQHGTMVQACFGIILKWSGEGFQGPDTCSTRARRNSRATSLCPFRCHQGPQVRLRTGPFSYIHEWQ